MTEEAKKIVDALRCMGDMKISTRCQQCNYYDSGEHVCRYYQRCVDAADLIKRLSADLEQLRRERDAAVRDLAINRSCAVCKNNEGFKCAANGCAHENEWKWRGVCVENNGGDE